MGGISPKFKKGVPVFERRFKVFVTPDGLKAFLIPEDPAERLSPEDLKRLPEELQRLGLVYGLLDPPEREGHGWLVAQGIPSKDGQDARWEFLIDLETGPKKRGSRLDFREMNAIVCVREGEAIAKKIPPTKGQPGRNVFGHEIPAKDGEDQELRAGENVFFDGYLLRAKTSGVVEIRDGRLEVFPEYVLYGDVDWGIGNVYFSGRKLTITGGVKRGFKLRVEGDLEIQGFVEDEVEIDVSGRLVIGGLAHGQRLRIRCAKEAHLGEIEYARLEIGENLRVSEYLLQVQAVVGGHLVVTEGIGAVIGGEYFVRGGVTARILGSRAGAKTFVYAGYEPSLFEELDRVEEALLLAGEQKKPLVLALRKGLELLKAGKLSPKQIEVLEKGRRRLETLLLEERRLKSCRSCLLEKICEGEREEVVVLNRIFPGVTIGIGRLRFTVTQSLEGGVFLVRGNQIIFKEAAANNFTL